MSQFARSPKQLGRLIRNRRLSRTLTQQGLADLVGTGQKTISRIECGHPGTRLDTLFALITALDLEVTIELRRKTSVELGDIF